MASPPRAATRWSSRRGRNSRSLAAVDSPGRPDPNVSTAHRLPMHFSALGQAVSPEEFGCAEDLRVPDVDPTTQRCPTGPQSAKPIYSCRSPHWEMQISLPGWGWGGVGGLGC